MLFVVHSLSPVQLFVTQGLQHARIPHPSLSPRDCSNSCPLSRWCHPIISSSAALFSFCLRSCPATGSFPMSQFLASGGQSIGVSASASVFPMNIQDWFPLGLTGLTSLQSTGLSRVFSSTIIQKHYRLNGHGFGWTPEVGDGQGGLVCCGSWGRRELNTTERLNWTETKNVHVCYVSDTIKNKQIQMFGTIKKA